MGCWGFWVLNFVLILLMLFCELLFLLGKYVSLICLNGEGKSFVNLKLIVVYLIELSCLFVLNVLRDEYYVWCFVVYILFDSFCKIVRLVWCFVSGFIYLGSVWLLRLIVWVFLWCFCFCCVVVKLGRVKVFGSSLLFLWRKINCLGVLLGIFSCGVCLLNNFVG